MRRIILVAVTVLAIAGCQDRETAVDQVFSAYQGSDMPGASVMVVRDGEQLLIKSYGMADIENSIEVQPRTNFRLASITKQFTATGIMMLVEEGRLQLDDTLTELFPDFPDYGSRITLRHLLQHNSGLIDYESLMPEDYEGQISDREALALMYTVDTTYFEPGTEYRYSNTAYAMMSVLIENLTGTTYAEFIKARIFDPLGMDNSVAFQQGISTVPHRAIGYTVDDGTVTESDQCSTSAVLGDGGIYTSVLDYYRWDQALYTEKLLSQESLDAMWTGNFGNYGLGWRVDEKDGHRRLHHDGSTSGFRNYVIRYPDARLTVLVLTNRRGPDAMPLAEQVAAFYLTD